MKIINVTIKDTTLVPVETDDVECLVPGDVVEAEGNFRIFHGKDHRGRCYYLSQSNDIDVDYSPVGKPIIVPAWEDISRKRIEPTEVIQMQSVWQPSPGDVVEVSDDGECWFAGIYLDETDLEIRPYLVGVATDYIGSFWQHCRHCEPTEVITLPSPMDVVGA